MVEKTFEITPNFVKAHLFGIDVVIILRSKYGGNSKKSLDGKDNNTERSDISFSLIFFFMVFSFW